PVRPPFSTGLNRISPVLAYSRMLRASSEIAVAIRVRSPPAKPKRAARPRPIWRAITRSAADRIGTATPSRGMTSPRPPTWLAMRAAGLRSLIEVREPFLQVECRGHVLEGETEPNHRECDLGLDAHAHGRSTAQPDHVGDSPQRSHREGVHDVEHRDVHDRPPGSVSPHLLYQVVPEMEKVLVAQGGLDGGDEVVALLEDGDAHRRQDRGAS